MTPSSRGLFEEQVWRLALEKYGAVTRLTVTVFDAEARVVCGPAPATPLLQLFEEFGYAPGILEECARLCLAQTEHRPAVVTAPSYGLAVVGTSLVLEQQIVGAAVAGYALVDFTQSSAIAALARQAGLPFRRLWEIAQRQQPLPERRLILHGELLQVLGDTILRENHRTRQYEDTAAKLQAEMTAKDEFLAVLSHELRTPLTPILGWTRILQIDDRPASRAKAIEAIERNTLLQVRLIDDLLDLNRVIRDKVRLEIGRHDLSKLLCAAVETFAEVAARKNITLSYIEPVERFEIEGDAGRLQQVFANVLSNALKFTPERGWVRVTAERDETMAIVRIADSGEGIAPDFIPLAFDMFHQQEQGTRRRHAGLGIGLAIVKGLVDLHHGQIGIASGGAGQGTEVTIRLPLTRRNVRPLQNLTLLAVEDMEDSLDALRLMLELLGAEVLVAHDGLEALEVMTTHRPDMVLCDLRMPRMDGFEFIRELDRVGGPDRPPVVAVSGLDSDVDRQRTKNAGFEAHLGKPFDDKGLVSVIRSTLDHRRSA